MLKLIAMWLPIQSVCLKIADQPEIAAHPQNVTTTEEDKITLSCDAAGNPVAIISWTKDGSAISSISRISLSADNRQLTITNASRTDRGEYRCVASNSLGNDTSKTANVDVQCKFSEKFVCIRSPCSLSLV